MNQQYPKIDFPVQWNYKIIVESTNLDQVCQKLEQIWKKYQKLTDLSCSNQSKSGKYTSLVVSFNFDSKEELDSLSSKISKTPGVKFLL